MLAIYQSLWQQIQVSVSVCVYVNMLFCTFLCVFQEQNDRIRALWVFFSQSGQVRREYLVERMGGVVEYDRQGAWVKYVLMQMRVILVRR